MKQQSLLLAIIFMISIADVSVAQVRKELKKLWASDMSYEVTVVAIGADGTKLLKVWGYAKKIDLAKINAKKNAVAACLFKGAVGNRKKNVKPILPDSRTADAHKAYFNKFFETGGQYLQYVGLTIDATGRDIVKMKKGYKVGIVVSVNYNALRKEMERHVIEKKLANVLKYEQDNSPPIISIIYPNVSRGFKVVEQNKEIVIKGKATDKSGIFEVLINGQEAYIDAQGNFSKTVLLAIGDNSFTVTVTDVKQNTIKKQFTIERVSNQHETVIVNNQNNNTGLKTGKYYALIIGVSEYTDQRIPDLDGEPTKDASELYNVLTNDYTFEKSDIKLLTKQTYKEIIRSFDYFSKVITENDNFLIFYAGHGNYDEKTGLGFWLPSDADMEYTDAWLYNSVLVDNIKKINSKHTLLIADACFSGGIFKTRALPQNAGITYQKKYELKSRNTITSGTLKTVSNKSVFFYYFIDRLKTNTQNYMSAGELFGKIEIPIGSNSPNTPQFGDIQNVGHEGGDFIFIHK